ncbi:MAG: DUF465 domain-containing protein [Desulfobacterales bacterium]|jgi:uncharacterized protein YdcH (DUF465 family)|nr:DUF465 domain-containing protein [Desulfobacterales bacterium]
MEKRDAKLIEKLVETDKELKSYVDDHIELEKKLAGYHEKPYLTPEEEIERKRIQKLKLAGKDKIEEILSKYR